MHIYYSFYLSLITKSTKNTKATKKSDGYDLKNEVADYRWIIMEELRTMSITPTLFHLLSPFFVLFVLFVMRLTLYRL